MKPTLPPRAELVGDFVSLLQRRFTGGVNALCLQRELAGDFDEVARAVLAQMGADDELVTLDEDSLRGLSLSPAGRLAAEAMAADLARLTDAGLDPTLNCIRAYARDMRGFPIATDVMSFHVDRSPVEVHTFLCTYAGGPSELLDNDEAVRRIDEPGVREVMRQHFDEAGIVEGSFDLHFRPRDGAQVYSCGLFSIWKLAVDWPGALVPPCIHRAPSTDAPRLLLIA